MSSWASIISTGQAGLGNHTRRMAALQEQAATGARISRASDDPSTAYRILTLRAQAGILGTYAENLADVAGMLEQNHNVVSEVSSSLQTVLAKVEQAASGTYGQSSRNVVAGEIDGILEQMLFVVNTDAFGRYLFSGAKTDTAPYASESDGEYITAVNYMGSNESLPVPVAPGVTVSSVAVGERAFRGDNRQDPNMLGQTGATAGLRWWERHLIWVGPVVVLLISVAIIYGTREVSEVAEETLRMMKKAMGLTGVWNRISRKARDAIKKDAKNS